MNFRAWSWLTLGALAACTSGTKDEGDTDSDTVVEDTDVVVADTDAPDTDVADTDIEGPHVLHVCAPTVGNICPYAGSSRNGFNGDGHDKLDSWFSFPMSITFSPYGKPAIADWNNHKIRVVNDDGTLTTIMGTNFLGDGDALGNDSKPAGALGTDVNLNHPTQQEYRPDGVLVSASWHTHKLRTWDPATSLVHVYLGSSPGFNEPANATAGSSFDAHSCLLNQPRQVHIDSQGDMYIVDMRNERIRKLDVDAWTISTVAGTGAKAVSSGGDALTSAFNFPKSGNPEPGGAIAMNADESVMYISDTESHVIKALDLESGTVTVLAGLAGTAGDVDGAAADARFNYPVGLALDGDTLFVADANNHKVRAIDVTTGEVSTFVGTGEPTCAYAGDVPTPEMCDEQYAAGDGGPASQATLFRPFGVDLDLDGNLVIADTYNNRFRIVYR